MKLKIPAFVFPCLGVLPMGCMTSPDSQPDKPNILFIAIDDQNNDLSCYGRMVKSPNIDKLASEGILFQHHYVQTPTCIPSRVSMLTGMRPERTRQLYGKEIWDQVPGAQSWGNVFRHGGYESISLGKIWHWPPADHPDTFDIRWVASGFNLYADSMNNAKLANFRSGKNRDKSMDLPPITECMDVPDTAYVDGRTASKAIRELRRLAKSNEPFMLAVGFIKPHLPFCSPKKYWDLYNESEITLAEKTDFPENMPEVAFNHQANFFTFSYENLPPLQKGEAMPDVTARHLRHAYWAASSFTDAQIGKVLDELKNLKLDKNTLVVLWSDHGFHLGDIGHWSKHTNFEASIRSPLIVKVPWLKQEGVVSDAIVESVDILPTMVDVCGFEELEVSDGRSFLPLLKNPEMEFKRAAYSVMNRWRTIDGESKLIIGHAVRTQDYRYVSWRLGWGMEGEEVASELYDYSKYPYETVNLADNPNYATIQESMEQLLFDGPPGQFSGN